MLVVLLCVGSSGVNYSLPILLCSQGCATVIVATSYISMWLPILLGLGICLPLRRELLQPSQPTTNPPLRIHTSHLLRDYWRSMPLLWWQHMTLTIFQKVRSLLLSRRGQGGKLKGVFNYVYPDNNVIQVILHYIVQCCLRSFRIVDMNHNFSTRFPPTHIGGRYNKQLESAQSPRPEASWPYLDPNYLERQRHL